MGVHNHIVLNKVNTIYALTTDPTLIGFLLQDQYIFIHDAILEVLTCGDTQITATNFRLQMDKLSREDPTHKCTVYQHQFNVLDQVTPCPTEVNCSTALNNPNKNRGDKYLPGALQLLHFVSQFIGRIMLLLVLSMSRVIHSFTFLFFS